MSRLFGSSATVGTIAVGDRRGGSDRWGRQFVPGPSGRPRAPQWADTFRAIGETLRTRCSGQGNVDIVSGRFAEWDKELSHVIQANQDVALAELMLRRHVATARKTGHSWATIGLALGVTRQAAQQRFGVDGAPTD
jgi:hypothetical protein